jgi:hypothetical protein
LQPRDDPRVSGKCEAWNATHSYLASSRASVKRKR